MSGGSSLTARSAELPQHLRTISLFALNRPPMRAKVDRQSFDELKPGVDSALAILDWFEAISKQFCAALAELGGAGGDPSAAALAPLVACLDACVVLENQYGGWSACINRFSWFKRTFSCVRRDVEGEIDAETLQRNIARFQSFIGNAQFPIGMHLTGPLRNAVKKVPGHERVLLAALMATCKEATSRPDSATLRPLPYLIYLADGNAAPSSFNVFHSKLAPVQKLFKRNQTADCSPPEALRKELDLPAGHPVHLGTVLTRCPHFTAAMGRRWGMAGDGDGGGCAIL